MNEALIQQGIKVLAEIIGLAISYTITYLIAKRLIRYGIDHYFSRKIAYDSRREIDEIQQDLVREHPAKEDKP